MWTRGGGAGVVVMEGGASGRTKSREIELLTPSAGEFLAESNPGFFSSPPTNCFNWLRKMR